MRNMSTKRAGCLTQCLYYSTEYCIGIESSTPKYSQVLAKCSSLPCQVENGVTPVSRIVSCLTRHSLDLNAREVCFCFCKLAWSEIRSANLCSTSWIGDNLMSNLMRIRYSQRWEKLKLSQHSPPMLILLIFVLFSFCSCQRKCDTLKFHNFHYTTDITLVHSLNCYLRCIMQTNLSMFYDYRINDRKL